MPLYNIDHIYLRLYPIKVSNNYDIVSLDDLQTIDPVLAIQVRTLLLYLQYVKNRALAFKRRKRWSI